MLTPEHAAQLVAHAVYITGLIVCVLVVRAYSVACW